MSMDLAYILRGYEISNTAKVIYGLLDGLSRASASNGLPYTYIGQRAIAERVGVCERTAHTAIKQLVSAGLIMVKRRGLTKTNAMYVLSPNATKEERSNKKAICGSRNEKNSFHNINTQRVIKTIEDKPSIPSNENCAASPQNRSTTPPKGKPTNKRPRVNVDDKQRLKKEYKEYLIRKLKLVELKNDILSHGDDIRALEKLIELISNTMSSKGKIMVNGALLMPIQWWSVVKNIEQDTVFNLIYRLEHSNNIKNYRAYLLASLYNAAMEQTLRTPWYSAAY